jgi:pyruvate dehydrogenase (quinone)/pyruvate oxidase
MDVCVYNNQIMSPAHVENTIELACRTALAYRGVSHITLPVGLQSQSLKSAARSKRNVPGHVSDLVAESAHVPTEDQLAMATAVLNEGKAVAILAGRGALHARDEVIAVAERLGAPNIKPLLSEGVVPDDHPYTTGGSGLLGTRPSQEALENCDTLLMIRTSFPYIEYYPKPDQAKCVQIELDPKRVGLRNPTDAALVAYSARVLQLLLPTLDYHQDRSFLEEAQKGMEAWRELMQERGTRTDTPMKPQVVAHELSQLMTDDAILATDSGTITTWAPVTSTSGAI